ncbi:porin [Pandoraea pnomenusa]|uniref:porin n=1 Tax=Pandoraea pnomenusa TaxID=93220 RepID=UPI00333FDD62
MKKIEQSKHFAGKAVLITTVWIAGTMGSAYAQDGVSISGILDTGLRYVSHVGTPSGNPGVLQAASGQIIPSSFQFKGTESLGGATQAIFLLRAPFLVNTGQSNGRAFNISYVGLQNDKAGAFTLGRQVDLGADFFGTIAAMNVWSGMSGAHIGDADNLYASTKISNMVKFKSASFGGFSAGATYAFSQTAGAADLNRLWSVGAKYASGPLQVATTYTVLDSPGATANGAVGSTGVGVNNDYSGLFRASARGASVQKQEILVAGGKYDFGSAAVAAIYSNVRFRYLDATSTTLDNYDVSATYQLSVPLMLGLGYTRTYARDSQTAIYNQFNAGLTYSLSKRTLIYLQGIAQIASRQSNAQIFGAPTSGDNHQYMGIGGIEHFF